jgi:hypothetical protein
MEQIVTIKKTTRTPFFSLFIPNVPSPQESWVRDLIVKKAEELKGSRVSLSQYLTQLIVDDMLERKAINLAQAEQYKKYVSTKYKHKKEEKKEIKTNLSKKSKQPTFCLYLIKSEEFDWLTEVLSADFIRSKTEFRSRSVYIWNLFVEKNFKYLSREQKAEWRNHMRSTDKEDVTAA